MGVVPVVVMLVFVSGWVVVALRRLGNEFRRVAPGVAGEAVKLALRAIAVRVVVVDRYGVTMHRSRRREVRLSRRGAMSPLGASNVRTQVGGRLA